MPRKDVCQKQACAIQTCLQANKYKESMCQDLIKDMRRCCDQIGNHSTCCEGFLRDQKPTQNTATLST